MEPILSARKDQVKGGGYSQYSTVTREYPAPSKNITTAVPHSKLARGVQPQGKRSALQDQSNKYCVPDSTVKKPLSQLSKDIPRETREDEVKKKPSNPPVLPETVDISKMTDDELPEIEHHPPTCSCNKPKDTSLPLLSMTYFGEDFDLNLDEDDCGSHELYNCKAVEEELDSIELPDIPDFEDLPDF